MDPGLASNEPRRNFFKEFMAVVIGGLVTAVPALAGLAVLMDPLRRKGGSGGLIRITSLEAIPESGLPKKFPVLADKQDAWNKLKDTPIGAVYLRRKSENKVQALNVICPHAGCFVALKEETKSYFCPCHNSAFDIEGAIASEKSPSPRPMDELEVEVREDGSVWVKFQNFRKAIHEKEPVV